MNYYLGIDIGTTKVATVICNESGKIVEVASLVTGADIDGPHTFFEQSHEKIFRTLDLCMDKCSDKNKKHVIAIGVTGQMHGVILWGDKISPLITWQDKRCNEDNFLTKISEMTGEALSSGFGSATLAWLAEQKALNNTFRNAATIHDFLVAQMCGLDYPVMDPTNAASWGLYDLKNNQWQKENIKKLNIPEQLYPKIVSSGSKAGELNAQFAEKWGLHQSIPVSTAIGDNQASLLSTINDWDKEISLTIGTGAQVSVVLPQGTDINKISTDTFDIRPFVNGRYIAVAAPLCGDSALAWLINWFSQWCKLLGLEIPPDINLYDFFIEEANKEKHTDLQIASNFLGERHSPELRGEISNISLENFTPGQVALALSSGIIQNLKSMMPKEFLVGKEKIIASGNALRNTPLLLNAAAKIFQKPIDIVNSKEEAACGAAKCFFYNNHPQKVS